MGYIAHDAVIAVVPDWEPQTIDAIEVFRSKMDKSDREFLVGPVVGTNGYHMYAFLPDGSKEGWETSTRIAALRDRFRDLVAEPGESVHVRFGGDFGSEYGPTIITREVD